jgi:dTDP-4-dehydrorhamnose 3,5-epimerase
MIHDVRVKPLRVIPDERGRLMEILRRDDPLFEGFGQVYMTTTYPGVIKAWHFHKLQNDNISVVMGMLKLVLYDGRENSPTKNELNEFYLGEHNPLLVHVPKYVYHGWKCIGGKEALAINCVTEQYDYKNPDEYRLPFNTDRIPYDWAIKMG